jgi:hypothetical protein
VQTEMIRFCEDCGKKNRVDSVEFTTGKARFRCAVCGYLSPYHFKPRENAILEQAELFYAETRDFPEILGSFLFHRDLGLLKNHMPEVLKPADLDFLGKTLTRIHEYGQSGLGHVDETTLCIADKTMVVKKMGKTLFMVIACKYSTLPRNISERYFRPPGPDAF